MGCSTCIIREDLICLTKSGISAVRMTTVKNTMESVQVHPLSVPNTGAHREWKNTSKPDTTQYSGVMIVLKNPTMPSYHAIGISIGIS